MAGHQPRNGYHRKQVQRFMVDTVEITRGGVVKYSGKCSFKQAEANQGQLSEPDVVEGDISAYDSYDIWIPYDVDPDILEGDLCTLDPGEGATIDLTITAVELHATNKTAIQLRAVKQRTATELITTMTLIRIDPVTGDEEIIPAQPVRVVLEGATPIGAGAEVTGGTTPYIQGYLIFPDRDADVKAGDRFQYLGRFGEVTGVPTIANDRKEVRMRITGGGFS